MSHSWFPSAYITPEALHDVWFELDEPVVVAFAGASSQLSRDFLRKVEYAIDVLANSIGVKCVALEVALENEVDLINDWKINRYPTLLVYDGNEIVRLSEDLDREALVEWIRHNLEVARA